jgi:hypothetical protein
MYTSILVICWISDYFGAWTKTWLAADSVVLVALYEYILSGILCK